MTVLLGDGGQARRLLRRRLLVAGVVAGLLFAVLVGRLVQLQLVQHIHYTTLAHGNRVKVVPLPPPRGLIYDRNGVLLADNRPVFSLEVVPERAGPIDELLARLAGVVALDAESVARFRELLAGKRAFESIPLRLNLTAAELARFAVDRHRFPGVSVHTRPLRHYRFGEALSHVVGYVGRIDRRDSAHIDAANYRGTLFIGKTGVERYREALLHGRVGHQQVETNAEGRVLRVLDREPPVPGADLYLTIDVELQRAAMAALDGHAGAVVALEPASGEVLALVSSPGFDPNALVRGLSVDAYRRLAGAPDRPLFNRALAGRYPPGSTVKPVLGLAALAANVRDRGRRYWCPGWYSLPGRSHRYRDWRPQGHGAVDLVDAIEQSCDVYFYRLAEDLGIERMAAMLDAFGLGRPTGIDLPHEGEGLVPTPGWKRAAHHAAWFPGETLIAGIGQGYLLATPMELAVMAATIANRGRVVQPHVLAQVEQAASGEASDVPDRSWPLPARVPAAAWDVVIDAMEAVMHGRHGTARRAAAGADYRMAGKTGTAQVYTVAQDADLKEDPQHHALRDHALFIGFAPVREPAIAVAVVVEHGGSGASAAAPVARRLFDVWLHGREAGARVAAE